MIKMKYQNFAFIIYFPLNDVPMMPTASSNQMRRSASRRAAHIAIRWLSFLILLITSSHMRPVPRSRTAAATKSNSPHLTSSVNCIAINGMSRRTATVSRMPLSLLFCTIINKLLLILYHKATLYQNSHILSILFQCMLFRTALVHHPAHRSICWGCCQHSQCPLPQFQKYRNL